MKEKCVECYKPIEGEVFLSPGMKANDGTFLMVPQPYHKECYDKTLKAYQEDVSKLQAKKQAEREDLKADYTRLSLQLLKENTGYTKVARIYLDAQPMYFDDNGIWWRWNRSEYRWEITDDTWVIVQARRLMKDILIGDSSIKRRVFLVEAFKQEARMRKPKDWPRSWIQFKNQIYNIKTNEFLEVSHSYFCANPIPWEVGESTETPTMDKLFRDWVGEEYVETLYEIIAYCVVQDYPIHRIFCFHGGGSNGKSKFLQLLTRFLGENNVVSSDLQLLADNRFESFKLYKKLACQMGETDYSALKHTNRLKRLCGQDPIDFEAKNKNPFTGQNYAKILIATNSLPPSGDTSDGFYRRWLIIDFPNQFKEGPDPVVNIPPEEFENLARKITGLLPTLLRECSFTNEGNTDAKKRRYVSLSNPLGDFLSEGYDRDPDGRVKYSEIWADYRRWLSKNKHRIVRREEFREALVQEGYDIDKVRVGDDVAWAVIGLSEKVHVSSDGRNARVDSNWDVTRIKKPVDVISFLKSRGGLVPYEVILDKLDSSLDEGTLSVWLVMMCKNGDVVESKPGRYQVL